MSPKEKQQLPAWPKPPKTGLVSIENIFFSIDFNKNPTIILFKNINKLLKIKNNLYFLSIFYLIFS